MHFMTANKVPSSLVTVVVGDVCWGKGIFSGVVVDWRFCSHWYVSMEYRIVKWVLTRR
jgi:hypothetical protein